MSANGVHNRWRGFLVGVEVDFSRMGLVVDARKGAFSKKVSWNVRE